jgi:protein-S-isoprenylcysteine O-methyltransferase Ste14
MTWISRAFVVACWIVWGLALRFGKRSSGGRAAVKVAPDARLGVGMQLLAYAPLLIGGGEPTLATRITNMACGAAAAAITWWAVLHLRGHWQVQAGLYEDHKLVQSGPYRLLRHPIYFSMLLLLVATGFGRAPMPVFAGACAMFLAGTEIRVRAEDRLLAGRFGEEFQAYRSNVPAYIPFLR